jgi:hypothetical protein
MIPTTAIESERPQLARAIVWTTQADARLSRLVSEGISIRGLARSFGIGRQAAHQRALKLGLIAPEGRQPLSAPRAQQAANDAIDPGREALPAGHPTTWGLIVQSTCLEGIPYPAPEAARLTRPLRSIGEAA